MTTNLSRNLKNTHDAEQQALEMVKNLAKLPEAVLEDGRIKRVDFKPTPLARVETTPVPEIFLVIRERDFVPYAPDEKHKTALGFSMWGWVVEVHYKGATFTTRHSQGVGHVSPPTVFDVLYGMISDAQAATNVRDFKEFASEFGYSDDSIKAKETYEECLKVSAGLVRLLGADFTEITSLEEDDLNERFKDCPTFRMPGVKEGFLRSVAAVMGSGHLARLSHWVTL